jgi:catechol 2,3-dioxygenase-like lactoylglutathione lyase family enzyme
MPDPFTLHHVSLYMRDVNASAAFYADILGLQEIPNRVGRSHIEGIALKYASQRRHYQSNTATFERRSIPSALVRRISLQQPSGTWRGAARQRYSHTQGLGNLTSFTRPSRRLACDNPLRPAKADLIEVEIDQMRADRVEHARDGAADAVIEVLRRVGVNRTSRILAGRMETTSVHV